MSQHVKLSDLAKATGFTVNTVSRALRDMPDISEATKAVVKENARIMGYMPNYAARMIRTKQSETIGVIFTDIRNPVFGEMFTGIDDVIKKTQNTVIICNTNECYEEEIKAIKTLIERRVDGILMIPTMGGKKTIETLCNMNIPFVLLGRYFFDFPTNVVSNNDRFGGYLAGQHLIQKGYKKFLYIAGPLQISSVTERLEGFKKAIKEADIPEESISVIKTQATLQGGYDIMISLIEEKKYMRTAIFCFSDFIAYGVLKALKDNSITIPDDVAVMGYDNNQFSSLSNPSLTTINVPLYKIGEIGAEALIKQINTPIEERLCSQLFLEPTLEVRSST